MPIMSSDNFCTDCKKNTEVVFDHSSGDTVCSECGLVLESHSIDETSEWRTFANDSSAHDDHDPNRVGGPTNPLLAGLGGSLTTSISRGPNNNSSSSATGLAKWHNHGSNDPERSHLLSAFSGMAGMADHLGLVSTIKDRANEIYKKVLDENKASRGRNQNALQAACLYVACKQEELPRTVKEICSVANGVSKKDLGRAKSYISKLMINTDEQPSRTIRAADFIKRFCSHLGIMNNKVMKAAVEVVDKAEEDIDIRRSPISVAAAVIYLITQLTEERKSLKDISVATGVAEGTIRNVYKDLYPHLSKIVPDWFAKEDDLRNLSSL